jgi:hypothetical protein
MRRITWIFGKDPGRADTDGFGITQRRFFMTPRKISTGR